MVLAMKKYIKVRISRGRVDDDDEGNCGISIWQGWKKISWIYYIKALTFFEKALWTKEAV